MSKDIVIEYISPLEVPDNLSNIVKISLKDFRKIFPVRTKAKPKKRGKLKKNARSPSSL